MADNSRVVESSNLRRKVEKQLQTPINAGIQTNDIHDNFTQRRGKWVKPDPEDDTIELHKQYMGANQPLGQLTVDKSLLSTLKSKKEQEAYVREIQLANYLIDKDIPESQERVFQIYNELKDVPDKQFADDVEQQETLRIMLRDGVIRGKDDHAFILRILEPDYFLPTSPIWDDDRKLIEQCFVGVTVGQVEAFINFTQQPKLYNPVTYQYDPAMIALFTDMTGTAANALWSYDATAPQNSGACARVFNAMLRCKLIIALRLYPGLKTWWYRWVRAQNPIPESDIAWYNDSAPARAFRNCGLYRNWYLTYFINKSSPVTTTVDPRYLSFL